MRVGFLLLAVSVIGCAHGPAPTYNTSKEAADGQFGQTQYARLGPEGNDYVKAFRYQVPSAGILRATMQSATARGGQVTIAITREGSDDPVARGGASGIAEAKIAEPGAYYVSVSEPYTGAVSLEVYFDVTFAPTRQ